MRVPNKGRLAYTFNALFRLCADVVPGMRNRSDSGPAVSLTTNRLCGSIHNHNCSLMSFRRTQFVLFISTINDMHVR
jgi:hypothetical protein